MLIPTISIFMVIIFGLMIVYTVMWVFWIAFLFALFALRPLFYVIGKIFGYVR